MKVIFNCFKYLFISLAIVLMMACCTALLFCLIIIVAGLCSSSFYVATLALLVVIALFAISAWLIDCIEIAKKKVIA